MSPAHHLPPLLCHGGAGELHLHPVPARRLRHKACVPLLARPRTLARPRAAPLPDKTCGFVGSLAALVGHFAGAHGWQCTGEILPGHRFPVHLRDGFNFLTAVRESLPDQGTITTNQYLFLLNVAQTPFGHAISAVLLSPQAATTSSPSSLTATMKCEIELSYSHYKPDSDSERSHFHSQSSRFHVPCLDPSTGELPDPNVSFQFFIPKYIAGFDAAACKVTAALLPYRANRSYSSPGHDHSTPCWVLLVNKLNIKRW